MEKSFRIARARLIEERKMRKWSQQELADRIGTTQNNVSRWELGITTPSPYFRAKLCELFGTEAHDLGLLPAETVQNDVPAQKREEDSLQEAQSDGVVSREFAPEDPCFWFVPYRRNPWFTGQKALLEHLTHALRHTAEPLALCGMGGIGKTQLALEYAYQHALEYGAVFWIGAETVESIVSGLLRIAEVLQLPGHDDKDQQRVVAAVQQWLTMHSQWLLIWDNVEDLALLDRFLPVARQGAMLLTTRRQALGTLARSVDLAPMEQEEGMLFLLRRTKVLEPEATSEQVRQLAAQAPSQYTAAMNLVTAMGGLPLALDQAGAYIEETGCSLADYLQRYERQRVHLLDRRGVLGGDHPHSVAATFRLLSERIEREYHAAADILRVCSLLHAEAIPEELFVQGAAHLGLGLESLAADLAQFDQAIAVLRSLSLVQRQAETHTFSLHRLVQFVLREQMSEHERTAWLRRVVGALNEVFPEVAPETWKQCERLLPHALISTAAIPDQAGDQELVRLLGKAADYLRERGQSEQAEPLYERALRLGEQVLGSLHSDVAYLLTGLAYLYLQQGKYEQTEPLYERALRIRERALGSEHPLLADPLNGLAILYRRQGKDKQAEPLYERALRIREQALGPEHPQLSRPLYNLAHLYLEQGKYAQAEPLFQRVLKIEEQTWGAEHPGVAYPLIGLASLYERRGQDAQAEPLFQRVLRLWEQAWGPEHLQVAYPLHNLAIISQRQGKPEQAECLSQRALHITELALGPEHPDVAHPLNGLADLYAEQGKYEQAEPLYQRALRIREQQLGQYHPETAQTLHDLARFRKKQDNLCEARSFAERALAIRSQSLGDAHPQTIATQALYAQLRREQKECDAESFAGQQPGSSAPSRTPVPSPVSAMCITVRGATEQVAYTRSVRMREVTFTCMICGQTVTQPHYPSGQIKYCSDACRAVRAAQMQEERVARQREKRRAEREAHLRAQ